MASSATYDYVIVGAGSAGCTLAYRLGADTNLKILVVEAGGWDRDPWIHIPLGFGRMLQKRPHDWDYFAEPEPTMAGRRVECARGKVIGGSSSVNAMTYTRGHRGDYQRWADEYGLAGWSYADVLPYFKRSEDWEDEASPYRGSGGPLTVHRTHYADPMIDAYAAAGQAAGHPVSPDYNGAEQHGFSFMQCTVRDGRRCSAAVAYLRPAMARGNVTVEVEALVTRIVIEQGEAVGIEYEQHGERHLARAAREVLLAGGAINSPQLLLLSGIGDPAELARHGIKVAADVPGVGKNLQDHISALVEYSCAKPGALRAEMRLDKMVWNLAQAHLFGKGFATDLPGRYTAFLKTDSALAMPDYQLLFRTAPVGAKPYLPFTQPYQDAFGSRAILLRPESHGTVSLASADARDKPLIRQNFLATEKDRRTLRAALRQVIEIGRQGPLSGWFSHQRGLSANPTDAELDEHIGKTGITAHHPGCSTRMGADSDPDAVVDRELKVRGVDRLRVVDAGVLPDIVGGNLNAPVIMIAEKASDMILGKAPLAALNV